MAKKIAKKEIKKKTKVPSKKETKPSAAAKVKSKVSPKDQIKVKSKAKIKEKEVTQEKKNSGLKSVSGESLKVEAPTRSKSKLRETVEKNGADPSTQDSNIDKSETKKIKIDRTGMSPEECFWADYYEKFQKDPAQIYKMSGVFVANRPLEHKTLGWGFVLSVDNDRLEVIFRSGKKILISNYKS